MILNKESYCKGFLWGVATSAYQAEGGYNGKNQPQTNWARVEKEKDVAPLGNAAEFWTRYPEDGLVCISLGARMEPGPTQFVPQTFATTGHG